MASERQDRDAQAPPAGAAPDVEPASAAEHAAGCEPASSGAELAADLDHAAGEPVEGDALAALVERAGRAEEYLGLAQRTQADFENFRKRMTRDVGAAEARGMGRLAKELLPALDNLDRALAALEAGDDEEHHLTKGIRLVQAELSSALQRAGIQSFAPDGEPFDPSEHEAVAQQPVQGAAPGTIVAVLQSGYRINGAILRPARVVVAGQAA